MLDGTGSQQLTPGSHHDVSPNWSPDGASIAFVRLFPANAEIFLISLTDGKHSNLTSSPGGDYQPRWSPDGRWIAFVRRVADRSHLWVMRADGTASRQLSDGSVRDMDPTWIGNSIIVFARTPAGSGLG